MTYLCHKSWSYDVCKIWSATDRILLSSWAIICPFTLPSLTARKMKLSKMKKISSYIIILHKCTKIMTIGYIASDIWRLRNVIVFLILGYTFPFYPPNSPKIKISKKEKMDWRYDHFTQAYQKSWSYASHFLRYGAWEM